MKKKRDVVGPSGRDHDDLGFQGNILAAAGITLSYGTFHGNAWAQADVAKAVTKAGS